jgi:predicted translin family RNA/ssDNA-binding protein
VQKLGKQAIFSVHRKDFKDATSKLDKCNPTIDYLLEKIAEQPSLRYGAVSGCLEEWAEGKLTLEWCANKRILSKSELANLNAEEYVGALSDFTGEIGRLAVAAASKRDFNTVSDILQADVVIYSALMQMNSSGKYTKKTEAVAQNLKKLEDIVYDLSIQSMGGRSGTLREPEPKEGDQKDAGDD